MDHSKRDRSAKKKTVRRDEALYNDGESSLSSLGSLPETTSVAKHFVEDLPSQRRFTTHLTASSSIQSQQSQRTSQRPSTKTESASSRSCPHCRKRFTNSWAIPKHVSVCSNRKVLNNKMGVYLQVCLLFLKLTSLFFHICSFTLLFF